MAQNKNLKIYLFLSVWGEEYRKYLTEFCFPSLLSSNNIQLLKNTKSKILIASPITDWNKIKNQKTFKELQQFVKLIHIKMPLKNIKTSNCNHMGLGHLKATQICFKDQAIGVALTPDLILSNGCIELIIKYHNLGYEILLLHALRYEKESLFSQLNNHAIKNKKEYPTKNLEPRVLTSMIINSLHEETETYRYENKNFFYSQTIPAILFDAPKQGVYDNKGYIIHCMSFLPLFIDYSKINKHNVNSIKEWTIDGDYLNSNFKNYGKIKLINDSDEAVVASWSSKHENSSTFLLNRSGFFQYLIKKSLLSKYVSFFKLSLFRERARSKQFDNLKRFFLQEPIFMHKYNLDKNWFQKSMKTKRKVNLNYNRKIDTFVQSFLTEIEEYEHNLKELGYLNKDHNKYLKNDLNLIFILKIMFYTYLIKINFISVGLLKYKKKLYLTKNKIKKSKLIDNKILTLLRSRRVFFYNQKRIGKLYGGKLYANFKLASLAFLLIVSSLIIIIAF